MTALDSIFGENEGSAIPPKISSFAKFKNLFKKPVRTFLGELVQVKDEVWNKILRNNRQDITGTVLPTIENADFAIRDTDGSTLYVKRFKGDGQERMYNVVVVNKHGEVEDYISSVHIKRDNNLRNKIKKGAELFLPNARTTDGTISRNNSTPGAKVANYSETAKPRFSRKPGESIFDYASRVSESVDRSVRERVSARDEYEKKVKSKGFQTKEALQNSMLGLQEFMFAIDHASGNKRYIEDIPDFENPILGENRLSSVNKEEMHQVAKTQFKPLMSAVAKLSGNGKESGELYDYMFAKHGLERDAVMRQREAQKEFDKYQKAHPKGTKTIEDFVASLEGKELSMEQKAVVDVFSGKSDNQKFFVEREDGKKQTYLLKQGNEEKVGAKHSLYRHYGTNSGVITADDVLKIPQVLERGERIEKAKGGKKMAVYTMDIDGAKYIVLTRVGKNNEIVDDFYSNKEGSESSVYRNAENIDNTPEGARRKDSEPSAKVEDKSESPKLFGEEIIDDGKKGSDSIDRSVRENPKNGVDRRGARTEGQPCGTYAQGWT